MYVSVADDRELRAAGLDPAEIVRDSARKGIAATLEAVRMGTPMAAGVEPGAPGAMSPRSPLRRRHPTSALDAVGVSITATVGKIGVPVVPASELDPLAE